MKKIIVHLPFKIIRSYASGSQIRPQKMIEAFERSGYTVDLVEGYGKERRQQIDRIKKNILNGEKYEFLYSESYNMPTLLSEKSHLPLYPFLEPGFFGFCKKHGIRIGLFYRDIHWNFPHYKQEFGYMKYLISYCFYYLDLLVYNKYVDVLYMPTKDMNKYVPYSLKCEVKSLPPGFDEVAGEEERSVVPSKNGELRILYVGGLGNLYQLDVLVKVVSETTGINLTICCREPEWQNVKSKYAPFLNERIRVVHKKGDELKELYKETDIASIFVKPTEYWNIVMPLKLFEYIRFHKPVLGVEGTAVGNFVTSNKIGWVLPYEEKAIRELLESLRADHNALKDPVANIAGIANRHTWKKRAETVINDLQN